MLLLHSLFYPILPVFHGKCQPSHRIYESHQDLSYMIIHRSARRPIP